MHAAQSGLQYQYEVPMVDWHCSGGFPFIWKLKFPIILHFVAVVQLQCETMTVGTCHHGHLSGTSG